MSHVKYLLLFVTSDHVDYKCTLIFTVDFSQVGATALHAACLQGHDRVAELLLQAGASVDQETKVRWESVKLCVILNSTRATTYLLLPLFTSSSKVGRGCLLQYRKVRILGATAYF